MNLYLFLNLGMLHKIPMDCTIVRSMASKDEQYLKYYFIFQLSLGTTSELSDSSIKQPAKHTFPCQITPLTVYIPEDKLNVIEQGPNQ